MEILLTTKSMVKERTPGQMVESIAEIGRITKWMARVNSLGLTDVSMSGNTRMIRKKGMVFSHGLMKGDMTVSGRMANSMEVELIREVMVKREKVNGKKEEGFNGLMKKEKRKKHLILDSLYPIFYFS